MPGKQKQCILSALFSINNDKELIIINGRFIYDITDSTIERRWDYDNNKSVYLYDSINLIINIKHLIKFMWTSKNQ